MKKEDLFSNKKVRSIITYLGRNRHFQPTIHRISESCGISCNSARYWVEQMDDAEVVEIEGDCHWGFNIRLKYENVPEELKRELDLPLS